MSKIEFFKNPYVNLIYDIVRMESLGLDAIYEDFIREQVGVFGLNALLTYNLIESCGVINGRKLYTLIERKE